MDPIPDCAVCMERFGSSAVDQRPRGLPCGHSLCQGCLGRLLQSRVTQVCPRCRHPLGHADIARFPCNFDLVETIENYQQLQDSAPRSAISADDLQLTPEVIGRGANSVVCKGVLTCRGNQLQVAVKILSVHGANQAALSRAEQEIENNAHAARACPAVVRMLGHCIKDQQLCLVMLPYVGSLVTLVEAWALATAGGMSQQQKLQTALQLAKGVQQLHGIRILHLDIKPQNVLVDQHGDVVLSDLGIAHQMQALSHYVPSSIGAIGTDNFMSPEATQYNATPLRESADVWSLGCTILYIFTQEFPFEGRNSAQIGTALQAGQTPAIPNSLPSDLRCMLGQCLAFRPNRRPTAAQVVTKLQTVIQTTSMHQATAAERIPGVCEGDTVNMKCTDNTGVSAGIGCAVGTILTLAGAVTYALLAAAPKGKS